ncbi:unnamed protein product [Gordionus sp. m RMFG-2023]
MSSNKGLRRNLRVQALRYKICKGKMHHHSHNGEVVLDLDRRIQLLQMVHSGCDTNVSAISLAAHFGITKTYRKLADRHNNKLFHHFYNSETILDCNRRVWTQIGVDLSALPESVDGYKYIAVAVDYFSKYIVVMPLKDKTAKSVSRFLYSLLCTHGRAKIQINDQGREFVNEISNNFHKLIGTMQRVTSVYHPQANGMVERVNRTIQNALLKCIKDDLGQMPCLA